MSYSISLADPDAAYGPILSALVAFNEKTVGDTSGRTFALAITPEGSDEIVGGLWAHALWGSFYIALVIVPEAARGRDLGSELLALAEVEALALGCREMWLDTFAFQARPFYERLGFTTFAQLDGPAPMFPRSFMRKALDPSV